MDKFCGIKSITTAIVLVILLKGSLYCQEETSIPLRYPIIPFPSDVKPAADSFRLNSSTKIIITNDEFENEFNQLTEIIKSISGISLQRGSVVGENCIVFRKDKS